MQHAAWQVKQVGLPKDELCRRRDGLDFGSVRFELEALRRQGHNGVVETPPLGPVQLQHKYLSAE